LYCQIRLLDAQRIVVVYEGRVAGFSCDLPLGSVGLLFNILLSVTSQLPPQ